MNYQIKKYVKTTLNIASVIFVILAAIAVFIGLITLNIVIGYLNIWLLIPAIILSILLFSAAVVGLYALLSVVDAWTGW